MGKFIGFVSAFDAYKSNTGEEISQVVVDCEGTSFRCRNADQTDLYLRDCVVLVGNFRFTPKGTFVQDEVVRLASKAERDELMPVNARIRPGREDVE